MALVTPSRPSAQHWPRSIATVCLSGTLPEKLDAAATAGFDGIEIFEADLLAFDGTPSDVRQIAAELGLTIDIFQPFRDFEAMPEPQRRRNLDRAERKFDVMQELGTDLVLVCSNVSAAALPDPSRAAADLAEMAERAHRRGLRIGYEALAWGRHVNLWSQAWRIVQEVGHPALGLIVDSFHTLSLNDDPSGIADVPGDRIFFVQLADAPKLNMGVLDWSRHFRNFPGQGALDVAGFVRAVAASGYTGPMSLEIFNDDFRAAPARLTARDGLRSLVLADAQAGVVTLPDPPRLDGWEFLEFAVDDEAAAELSALLAGIGFHRAGTHRSKQVELWRQGRVNIVLNSEPDSAASEHFLMHGPSVCAMALRVDDVEAALARADALLCPPLHERLGPGERMIPAVRAPDGMLVYLVGTAADGRTIWEDDFVLDPPPPGTPEVISDIDHVALALPAGRMDSFVLFWRAVFGLEPQSVLELPDPYGLVRSRAMVSPDGRVRLPLNQSEARETGTGRFVSASAGAAVHHIAFGCTDLLAAAEHIAARAVPPGPFLPMPANYYEDIGARWGLEDGLLARLETDRLLYDEDPTGRFLHAYMPNFAGRFFFELVERKDGYTGFGAGNAGVRMAAQAQRRDSSAWAERANIE